MKVLYAGSPEASRTTLEIILEKQSQFGFEVVGVLSNPPTAKGRHKELTPTPVAAFALSKGIPVFTPEHLDSTARGQISSLNADLLVCFAYGHIFGPKFLSIFKYGGINLHPSLLPKYRGCTPVPAAILNRDVETAATIQTLSLKMDEGEILAQQKIKLDGTETAESLLDNSAKIGAELICEVIKKASDLGKMFSGSVQTGEASYTEIITKDDAKIDWNESAETIEAKIRAYYSDPVCWTLENGVPLKILASKIVDESSFDVEKFEKEANGTVLLYNKNDGIYIKTGKGLLSVLKLQRQGKNPMGYKDFMNGARAFIGTVLQ